MFSINNALTHKEVIVGYSQVELENKLLDMYPEIREKNISPRISFDKEKNAWIIDLVKDNKKKHVCMDKEDADACIEYNKYCTPFGSALKDALAEL